MQICKSQTQFYRSLISPPFYFQLWIPLKKKKKYKFPSNLFRSSTSRVIIQPPPINQILVCSRVLHRTENSSLFSCACLGSSTSPFSSRYAFVDAPPPRDFLFVARPGARNNRAQTVWNSMAHAVDSSNAHMYL